MSLEDVTRVPLRRKDDDSVPRMPLANLLPLARQAAAAQILEDGPARRLFARAGADHSDRSW
jgi:hypothetical protein